MPRDVHIFTENHSSDYHYIVIKFDPDMMFDSPKEAFAFKYLGQLLTTIPPKLKIIKKK